RCPRSRRTPRTPRIPAGPAGTHGGDPLTSCGPASIYIGRRRAGRGGAARPRPARAGRSCRGPRALLLVPPSPHIFLGQSRDAVDDCVHVAPALLLDPGHEDGRDDLTILVKLELAPRRLELGQRVLERLADPVAMAQITFEIIDRRRDQLGREI